MSSNQIAYHEKYKYDMYVYNTYAYNITVGIAQPSWNPMAFLKLLGALQRPL